MLILGLSPTHHAPITKKILQNSIDWVGGRFTLILLNVMHDTVNNFCLLIGCVEQIDVERIGTSETTELRKIFMISKEKTLKLT